MQQETFKKLNTCMAWLVFAIAAIVYGLTVEPTASLWDCPEFIACGYKLEIGHPPGAPVFMLAANLFSQLASNPSQVALMVNLLSALLSAGCIFFLFLTVTHLSRKLICPISDLLFIHISCLSFAPKKTPIYLLDLVIISIFAHVKKTPSQVLGMT